MIHPRLPHSDVFARIAVAVREWLSIQGTAAEDECHEADANLDAVLRCETNLGLDQTIERIDSTGDGVLINLDDGIAFTVDALTGFFTDRTHG